MEEIETSITRIFNKEVVENLSESINKTGCQKTRYYIGEDSNIVNILLTQFVGRTINDINTIKFFSRKIIKTMLLVVLFVTFSCYPQPNTGNKGRPIDGGFTIKTIDSCEYIEYDYGIIEQRVYSLTHKGNCKYCITRNKK